MKERDKIKLKILKILSSTKAMVRFDILAEIQADVVQEVMIKEYERNRFIKGH